MKKLFSLLGMGLVLAGFVFAHETTIVTGDTSKDYKSGDTVTLYGISSHYNLVGEELEGLDAVEMYVYKNGVKGANLSLKEDKDRLWYEARYTLADNNLAIAVFRSIGGYTTTFSDGSRVGLNKRQAAAANPGKTITRTNYFSKWGKYYINPGKTDRTFSTPLGHDIEIIPLDNPADMSRGSTIRLRVLYRGNPLPNAEVKATYDYYDYRTMDAWFSTGRKTDSRGEISFRLDHPNIGKPVVWIFRAREVQKVNSPETDEENPAATLLFAVK
ncbi:phosphoribosylglycinamide formyltransferase [Spirochaetia bacterium]|nr:phosphoribosylglycinamide formyltransferase [Spirochaetia bacterium]